MGGQVGCNFAPLGATVLITFLEGVDLAPDQI